MSLGSADLILSWPDLKFFLVGISIFPDVLFSFLLCDLDDFIYYLFIFFYVKPFLSFLN